MEKNRIEITGTLERLQQITTKSGKPMARFLLVVGQDKFRVVAFGNLAGLVSTAGEGTLIGITGSGAINNWQTEDGAWRNDFQCTAWAVEIGGQVVAYEKDTPAAPRQQAPPMPQQERLVQEIPPGVPTPF